MDFINKQVSEAIPDLEDKFTELKSKMCMKLLDIDTHRRKWSIIINGPKGEPREDECITRSKVRTFAKDQLKCPGADLHPLAACHRLSQKSNAGIIISFVDLYDRNQWLTNAKNLKNCTENISISPDLPPVLRPMKSDLLKQRKSLPAADKQKSHIRYFPTWPYVSLSVKGQSSRLPTTTKETIVNKYLDY